MVAGLAVTVAIIAMARTESRLPLSDGPRPAVCTATAELWRLIQEINLDTNTASIFYAMATKARRVVVPATHYLTAADRLTWLVGKPENLDLARISASYLRRSSDPELARVEYDTMAGNLADDITEDAIDELGWNRSTCHFQKRKERLHSLVSYRLAEVHSGEHLSASMIAAKIGEPADSMKAIQADLTRAMRHKTERYQAILAGAELDPLPRRHLDAAAA
jgi:hypothetical protein